MYIEESFDTIFNMGKSAMDKRDNARVIVKLRYLVLLLPFYCIQRNYDWETWKVGPTRNFNDIY